MTDFLADFDLGTGTDAGTSWANAFKTPTSMLAGMVAGDRCFIQGDHSVAGTLTLAPTGTPTNPSILIGVKQGTTNDPVLEADVVDNQDDANMPSITTTGTNDLTFRNEAYWWGVKFETGDDMLDAGGSIDTSWIFEQCHIVIGAASGDRFLVSAQGFVQLLDCKYEAQNVGNLIQMQGRLIIKNLTLAGSVPTTLFQGFAAGRADCYGSDFSSLGSNAIADFDEGEINLIACRLGTSFVLINARSGDRWSDAVRSHLSDSGTGVTNPVTTFTEAYQTGDNADETTVVRSGGASDGVTSHSISMTLVDNSVAEAALGLRSPKIIGWVGSAGTSQNFDVFIHNTVADFDDDEVWLELFIPTNDSAQMSRHTTLPTPLATVAAITNDTSTWNGSADHSQRLRITATPDHEGPVFGWVYYAKRGASVPVCHVDPQIVISDA